MISLPNQEQNAALSILSEGREIIRIAADGTIYWLGREVVTDEYFKAAMLDLAANLKGMTR